MLTKTSLISFSVTIRIYNAMRLAIKQSKNNFASVIYVKNRKGEIFLKVKHSRKGGFSFFHKNLDVTKTVLSVLREVY